MTGLTALDLFSGIGGFSLAAARAGFRVMAQVEIDETCREYLASEWPETEQFADVREFTVDMLANSMYDRLGGDDMATISKVATLDKYCDAVEMYDQGLSVGDLAGYYAVSRQAMWMILKRRGCSFRSNLRYKEDNHFWRGGREAPDRVHNLTELAVEKGILVRPTRCDECSCLADKIEAHHYNYNKPLCVRWLCKKCHYEWHCENTPVELAVEFAPLSRTEVSALARRRGEKGEMPNELQARLERATAITLVTAGVP